MSAAVLLALLAGAGPPAPAERRDQAVFVTADPRTGGCVPKVNGVDTGDIATDQGRAALVRAVPDKALPLHLHATAGSVAIPFACMSAIVKTLRDAGYYGRIGAIDEPIAAR